MRGGDQDRGRRASARCGTPWSPISSSAIRRAGSKFSINDGGARPDTVSLRLAQAVRLIEEDGQ